MRPAAPAAPAAAAAPAPAPAAAPPASKPAASPLLSRMRDMLGIFGSGKKAAPPAEPAAPAAAAAAPSSSAAGAPGGIARLLSFGGPKAPAALPGRSASEGSVIDLSDGGPGPSSGASTTAALPRAHEPQPRQQQQQQPAAAAPAGVPAAAGAAKPPRSMREVKHRLMETLRAIKEAEAGGYYDRAAVDKVWAGGGRLGLIWRGVRDPSELEQRVPVERVCLACMQQHPTCLHHPHKLHLLSPSFPCAGAAAAARVPPGGRVRAAQGSSGGSAAALS